MKAKNKIISLLVTLSTIASMFTCFTTVASARKYPQADEAVTVLSKLGILTEKYNPEVETVVTREEFAVAVANAVKAPEVSDIRFTDIDRNDANMEKLNGLYDMGIISGYNRMFNPSRTITAQEAASIAMNATGRSYYKASGSADALNLAKDLEIIPKKMTQGDTMNIGEMAQIVYQMMQVTTMQMVGYEDGEVKMKDTGKTLFEMYHDVNIIESYVDGIYGTCLNDEIKLEANEISVGNEEYVLDYSISQMDVLGKNMRVVYTENSMGVKTIIYMTPYKDYEELVIEDDDYISFDFDKYLINYYVSDSKAKNAEISRNARFVYNGETLKDNVKTLMDSLNGSYDNLKVTLRDTDGEEGFDLVIIERYENFYVTGIDLNKDVVYGTNAGRQVSVSVSDLDVDYLSMTDKNFEILEIGDLKTDSIISVYQSRDKKHVRMIMNVTKMEGNIKSRDEDEHTFLLDGELYRVDVACWNTECSNIKTDTAYTAYLDYTGKVAKLEIEKSTSKVWGYLISAKIDTVTEECLVMKIASQDGTVKEYKTSEKIKIDGVSYKNEDPSILIQKIGETRVVNGSNKPKPQLLRFKTNSNEEITWLDTVNTTGSEDKNDAMKKNAENQISMYYAPEMKRFGFKTLVNSDTIFFTVPNVDVNGELISINTGESLGIRAQDSDYIVSGNTFGNAWYENIVGYTIGEDAAYQDVVVYTKKSGTAFKKQNAVLSVVQSFKTTLNADDEVTESVTVVNRNGEATYQALNASITEGIKEGDLVELSLDSNNIITDIRDFYAWKTDKLSTDWAANKYQLFQASGYRAEFQVTTGWVLDNQNGVLKVCYSKDNMNKVDEIIDASNCKVIVHDKSKAKNSTYIGNAGDITSYKQVGSDCPRVFINTSYTTVRCIIVYK